MTTKNSETQLKEKITSKIEINTSSSNFQGSQKKKKRQSIFNLQFQLKKQNKLNLNKYAKQCTNTKAIYFFVFVKRL